MTTRAVRVLGGLSTVQDFYFGDDLLLRRHDYHVDIAGGFAAAQYVTDIEEGDGYFS